MTGGPLLRKCYLGLALSLAALGWSRCSAVAEWQGAAEAEYFVGVGSYDVTGPAADVNLMGYANPGQTARGIHFRLRARAFIVTGTNNGAPSQGSRTVFVNLDACMGEQGVTREVVNRLKMKFGDLYTDKNIIISGIHTHSGPGGFLEHVVYLVTSFGFVRQSFDALVIGIAEAIEIAHDNLQPGKIFVDEGELLEANINRSPSAYLNNPVEERERYKHDVDKDMTLLKFTSASGDPLGALSFFPVHGVSMNRTNDLISGDNKGAASRFMEDWFQGLGTARSLNRDVELDKGEAVARSLTCSENGFDVAAALKLASQHPSQGGQQIGDTWSKFQKVRKSRPAEGASSVPFVAAFATSNEGDVSPNTLGPFCIDTGKACDFYASTCGGTVQKCNGRGPAWPGDHFQSTRIVGQRQFQKAKELFQSAKEELTGPVDFRQTYLNMAKLEVELPPKSAGGEAQVVSTCPAALGFSFAAGTTDGPGAFNFKQGDNQGNPFWRVVGAFLKAPSQEQVACQAPKPVLLDTGEVFQPYPWAPDVLPISIHRIGQLIILAVPAELSTMAGRRLRDAVKATLEKESPSEFGNRTRIVIAGLANAYSQYVTTIEEYAVQRYEGASTLFGPHTLSAYVQEFRKLAVALVKGEKVPDGPPPPNLLSRQLSFLPPVVADAVPVGRKFGDLIADIPSGSIFTNGDIVEAVFWSACPRNDLQTEGSFALVERLDEATQQWVAEYDDDDWCLKFKWRRPQKLSTQSFATLVWEIPQSTPGGVYRLRHNGAYKHFLGALGHFSGASSAFVINKRC